MCPRSGTIVVYHLRAPFDPRSVFLGYEHNALIPSLQVVHKRRLSLCALGNIVALRVGRCHFASRRTYVCICVFRGDVGMGLALGAVPAECM